MPRLNHSELLSFSERLLSIGGMPPNDSQLVAKFLVKAELRGYPGHGVTRISPYLSWIKDGTINIREKPKVEREGKITAIIDGNHYIGQVAAHTAMNLATEAGMIAMGAVSVGSATTTLYGGMKPITGTNPMAFGIPARNGRHIILDFATASMSMGEIQKRVARKEAIPDGVILDGHGNPTNDFKSFRGPPRGVFLPFGGHKGSGVALVTEILGGILSGNGPGRDWWDKGGHGVNGVFLQAFTVDEFQSLDSFYDKVDELISFVKSTKCAPGHKEIFLPGEIARRTEAKQLKEGVEIDEATWTQLRQLASELGVKEVPESF